MTATKDKPLLHCVDADEWSAWLEQHADEPDGVRLQLVRKGAAVPGISHAQALQVALCFGWIDGQAGSIDDTHYFVSFGPRRPRSLWSQINRDHIARLTAEGKMRPRGIEEVERAKADGRWDAAYRQKDAPIPDDLQAALDANPAAAEFFPLLSSQNRFAILFRIGNVKRAQTRAAKIATYVGMLERGETIYPQKSSTE
jgi:uncharacterized protein YdeI (YjbR/CyaY-like superfamily)